MIEQLNENQMLVLYTQLYYIYIEFHLQFTNVNFWQGMYREY